MTSYGCAVCHRPLNRFVNDDREQFQHPLADGNPGHQPQPVPIDQLDTVVRNCDFCFAPDPVWQYRTRPLVLRLLAENQGQVLGQNLGSDWAACTGCAARIEAGDVRGLVARVMRRLQAQSQPSPDANHLHILYADLLAQQPTRRPMHPTNSAAVPHAAQLPKVRDRLARWWHDHASDTLLDAVVNGAEIPGPAHLLDPPGPGTTGWITRPAEATAYTTAMAGRLSHASLYWIDAEFTGLARQATRRLPDFSIDRDQVPSASGLLVWATPIATTFSLESEQAPVIGRAGGAFRPGGGCSSTPPPAPDSTGPLCSRSANASVGSNRSGQVSRCRTNRPTRSRGPARRRVRTPLPQTRRGPTPVDVARTPPSR